MLYPDRVEGGEIIGVGRPTQSGNSSSQKDFKFASIPTLLSLSLFIVLAWAWMVYFFFFFSEEDKTGYSFQRGIGLKKKGKQKVKGNNTQEARTAWFSVSPGVPSA